jgi:thioredoxin-related protein
MEALITLVWIFMILVFAVSIFFLAKEVQKQKQGRNNNRRHLTHPRKSTSIPSHLQRQLLLMVGGEQATANRLLDKIRSKYPGREEIWY